MQQDATHRRAKRSITLEELGALVAQEIEGEFTAGLLPRLQDISAVMEPGSRRQREAKESAIRLYLTKSRACLLRLLMAYHQQRGNSSRRMGLGTLSSEAKEQLKTRALMSTAIQEHHSTTVPLTHLFHQHLRPRNSNRDSGAAEVDPLHYRMHVAASPYNGGYHSHSLAVRRMQREALFGLELLSASTKLKVLSELTKERMDQCANWMTVCRSSSSVVEGLVELLISSTVRVTLVLNGASCAGGSSAGASWRVVKLDWVLHWNGAVVVPNDKSRLLGEEIRKAFAKGLWVGARVTSAIACGLVMELITAQLWELTTEDHPPPFGFFRLLVPPPGPAANRWQFVGVSFFHHAASGEVIYRVKEPRAGVLTDGFHVEQQSTCPNRLANRQGLPVQWSAFITSLGMPLIINPNSSHNQQLQRSDEKNNQLDTSNTGSVSSAAVFELQVEALLWKEVQTMAPGGTNLLTGEEIS